MNRVTKAVLAIAVAGTALVTGATVASAHGGGGDYETECREHQYPNVEDTALPAVAEETVVVEENKQGYNNYRKCVEPLPPTWEQPTCDEDGRITIPGTDDDGVKYFVDDVKKGPGTYSVVVGSYLVTAKPGEDYRFPKNAKSAWLVVIEAPEGCEVPTTTTAPPTTAPPVQVPGPQGPQGPAGPPGPTVVIPVAQPAPPVVQTPSFTG